MTLKIIKGTTYYLSRYLGWLLAFALIFYAVIVVVGRQFLPFLDNYRDEVSVFFAERFGIHLQVDQLTGHWVGLTPRLTARGLAIFPDDQHLTPAIWVDQITAEMDLLRSLISGNPVWKELVAGEVQLTVAEDARGRWGAGGFAVLASGDQGAGLGSARDILLLSSRIRIDQVTLTAEFYSGRAVAVFANNLAVENGEGFHRLQAALALDKQRDSARLVVEANTGLNLSGLDGMGYLRLDSINLSGPLSVVAEELFPELVARIGDTQAELAAEFWIDGSASGGAELRGRITASEVPLAWAGDVAPIENLGAEVTGWYRPGEDWGVTLQGLHFTWGDTDIVPVDIRVAQKVGAHWGQFSFASSQLNIATLTQALLDTGVVAGKTAAALRQMNPSGLLIAPHVSVDVSGERPLFSLRTNISDLSAQSWGGAPAGRGISGYLEISGDNGLFELDAPSGFAMHFPQLYGDYLTFGDTRGAVNLRWDRDNSAFKIAGGPIAINSEEGRVQSYIYLDIPVGERDRSPEMFLLAGIRDSHSRFARQYIPTSLDPTLLAWLDRAVGDMDIEEGGFIWRGSLAGLAQSQHSMQVYARVKNGRVDYDPGWPPARGLSAYMTIDGSELDATVNDALIGDGRLVEARVRTRPQGDRGSLLTVEGSAVSSLPVALDILDGSPLRERVAMLADWDIKGTSRVALDLAIPLGKAVRGEHYRIATEIRGGQLQHRATGLTFENIRGPLGYDDVRGLHADNLTASFISQQVTAKIRTHQGATTVAAQGQIATSSLPIDGVPLLDKIAGKTRYRATLTLPADALPPSLTVSTQLKGIVSALPAPLHKTGEQALPLSVTVQFPADAPTVVRATLGENISVWLKMVGSALESGNIAFGSSPATAPEKSGLSISGELRSFDLGEWLPLFSGGSGGGLLAELQPRFSVQLDELIVGGQTLEGVFAAGRYSDNAWRFDVDSAVLAGEIIVPTAAHSPVAAHLDYLVLPKLDLEGDNAYLESFDPGNFPALDFSTEGLRIGESELGRAAFVSQPVPGGVRITNIDAELTGLVFSATPSGAPSELEWLFDGEKHRSRFNGALQSSDLGAVLRAWRMPVVLTSQDAAFLVDLSWPDQPWTFAAETLNGGLVLNLEQGKFEKTADVPTNALLKLIGLLNFDTWLRRLRFDFSDLFSKGVSYDRLSGGLMFDSGRMSFDAPIVVDMPSGKMRLLGSTDLATETLDARLVATLPVGTNLPWIAALVGGLPAAAGVYLTSRLFDKQVDKISSISYLISGSWDDPEVEVDRIFSDKTD